MRLQRAGTGKSLIAHLALVLLLRARSNTRAEGRHHLIRNRGVKAMLARDRKSGHGRHGRHWQGLAQSRLVLISAVLGVVGRRGVNRSRSSVVRERMARRNR